MPIRSDKKPQANFPHIPPTRIIGTALAAVDRLRQGCAEVLAAAFVIDLPDLGGAARLRAAGVPVSTLVAFEGD